MRLHPVIPMVVRTLMRPATIGGVDLPAGTTVGPSILISHARAENHPEPEAFRPERFVGQNPPTNTWIPFGGGVRRCIGAGFSLMEGVAVLREVLTAYDVAAVGGDEPKVRNITSVPRRGSRVRVERRNPRPETGCAPRPARAAWRVVKRRPRPRRCAPDSARPVVTWRDRLRALRMDITPLRESRDFRLLFVAGTVFYLGGMVSYVAIPYQIYTLTGSNFAVGAIGLVELVPLVVFGLYGGALADHVDRRRLLIWTGVAQAVFTVVLAVNAFRDDPSVWVIFVVAGTARLLLVPAAALPRGADAPHRAARPDHRRQRADQPRHADRRARRPAIGGLLVAYVGIGWCFVVDVAGLASRRCMYVAMRPYPHRAETTPPSLAGIGEGLRYALRAATCSAPTSSTSPRCCWRCRSCCSRRWPRRSSGGPSCSACSTPPRPSAP